MAVAEMQSVSLLAQVRGWASRIVREESEIEMPEIADRLTDRVLQEWPRDTLRDFIRLAVYEQVRLAVARTRGVILAGDTILRKPEEEYKPANDWQRWLEHVGQRHVRLVDMTRDDLTIAAQERRERSRTEAVIADAWDMLASKLGEGETVGQRFNADEIEAIMQMAQQKEGATI